jgi:hypothetical protein
VDTKSTKSSGAREEAGSLPATRSSFEIDHLLCALRKKFRFVSSLTLAQA